LIHRRRVTCDKIYQIDIDKAELDKGHPTIEAGLESDADAFLEKFIG
jgi:thiamine pyrophosphate-dependent acetolactate synthase large subunit-like protein